ncbi:Gfo/Idh/MocA family protein [Marinicrinis sediminis]|uniref:Gfo/Idh/MocA family protein n=1 Tax=Marinicrinis sediminis TaxID=1652465 RepID=A0ABW5RF12_9BACL
MSMEREIPTVQPIRAAVIGCGKIAQVRHLPEWKELSQTTRLTVLCDANRERAQALADQLDVPYVCTSHSEMLAQFADQFDAVSICTPNTLHAPVAMQMLEAGKHVLVEKPMALNWKDCTRMAEMAYRHQLVLLVAHNQRLHPVYKRAREIIQSGKLGRMIQFSVQFQHGGPEGWSIDGPQNWFLDAQHAGCYGVLADLGIHKLDLVRWMLGDEVATSDMVKQHVRGLTQIEDAATVLLQMESGITGTIQVSWCNPGQDHRTVFYGDKGNLILGESLDSIRIDMHDGRQCEETIAYRLREDGGMNSGVIEEFVNRIRTGNGYASPLSGLEAVQTMRSFFQLFAR